MNAEILKNAIQAAGEKPAALLLLREMYEELEREIEKRKPKCEMSGRCCHFEEFGHRLYVTGLELAEFLEQLSPPAGDIEQSKSPVEGESTPPPNPPPEYRGRSLISEKGCPFQSGKICSVYAIRPMGCRIFFCDPTAKQWMEDLYARFHAKMKAIHEEFEIPYVYVEWREGLMEILNLKFEI